ncbi:hypothetical protein L1987_73022 [Smallanthus sonchifolius]|uniref:Uncharacterized protein n=1 Tax=Smallanthus sonchifolius TaxID=185202 RepID=A0ACB9AXR0_9ASTR|nr:hypothetical protein L1987_73022 [Smallanthus sonchifolius]
MLGNSVVAYLNWVWDILCFFHHDDQTVSKSSQLEPGASNNTEPVECAVCLSMIEEDDEIRLLRWPRLVCELGRELIVFCFCGSTDDDYAKWWLR